MKWLIFNCIIVTLIAWEKVNQACAAFGNKGGTDRQMEDTVLYNKVEN
jgi:hypothetical protein